MLHRVPVLRSPVLLVAVLLLAAASGLAAAAWLTPRAYQQELTEPFARDPASWTTSGTCRACHGDQYASWHRTFHRTMTQEADERSVVGRFDGTVIRHQGVTARPVRGDQGGLFFEITYPDARPARLPVHYTVGSRRYQQYLVRLPGRGENLYRVPVLWHIGDQRWVHMNGAFLGADGGSFDSHLALWNQNCIFCHNTGPEPGLRNWDQMRARERRGEAVNPQHDARHRSRVAELGIACESCHGPGKEHAVRNRSPFRRYLLHVTERDDPTIVNPEKLGQQESVDLCGQCHGQRVPRSLDEMVSWVTAGPSFRAGDRLAEHVQSVGHETTDLWGNNEVFRLRFWADGTPRLTAYEYQGLMLSPCFDGGELTCISCHTMHGGDVFGQLPPENGGNAACLACHDELAADVPAHTFHTALSTGSSCYACHMPKMVYGIMEIHRSHRIENPDPAASAALGRPDACTSCHLDRSTAWAAEAVERWWGTGGGEVDTATDVALDPAATDPAAIINTVESLHAGDPVERAVAARLAGRANGLPDGVARAFLVPHLLAAMTDSYPAVRRFAHHSLRAIAESSAAAGAPLELGEALETFDFMAPAAARRQVLDALEARWQGLPKGGLPTPPAGALLDADYRPRVAEVERLRALGRARSKDIHIGE